MELVKPYTEFPEFTPAILNEFIEKVIIHEPDKSSGQRVQQVDIHLNFIGQFELPLSEEEQEEPPARKSKKKLRREMTEEEVTILRECDKVRYARKVSAKKAAEEAERVAILQGTAYEIPAQENEGKRVAS